MAARKLTVYKAFEATLVEFEQEYSTQLVQCDTPSGMKAAKASRKDIRDTRSNLEDLRKETKAPALAKCQQIDDEAKKIKERLDVLFTKFDGAIKEVEAKKKAEKQSQEAQFAAREEAIRAREIELGLRKPDPVDDGDADNAGDNDSHADSGSADSTPANRPELATTNCEPHIKAASERLSTLKRIRDLVEPTDAQPKGSIDEEIAQAHDIVLGKIWEIVDEYQ